MKDRALRCAVPKVTVRQKIASPIPRPKAEKGFAGNALEAAVSRAAKGAKVAGTAVSKRSMLHSRARNQGSN